MFLPILWYVYTKPHSVTFLKTVIYKREIRFLCSYLSKIFLFVFILQCALTLPDCVKCVRVFKGFFFCVSVMGNYDNKYLCFGGCH